MLVGDGERTNVLAIKLSSKDIFSGREPWSSGYGRRLIIWKLLWVRIQAVYTGSTFFTFTCCKIVMFVWKDEENEKEAGMTHF